ncbi:MAG: four helix bundle protein [Thermoplasmata archaeon]|nr:MAG: four helix bundle protein [Thermoplasmata archaeon]
MKTEPKKKKIYNIRDRVFQFSQRILEISELLPNSKACDVLRTQLLKSGTAIGSNLEEIDGTITKRDFLNKVVIARKEAKETLYWLRLIKGKYFDEEIIKDDLDELNEITLILSAIINKTRKKNPSL